MESPAVPTHVVVWRSTTVDCGGLCVMTPGLQQILVWLVVNLDFLLPIPVGPQVVLEGEGFVLCSYGIYIYIYTYAHVLQVDAGGKCG